MVTLAFDFGLVLSVFIIFFYEFRDLQHRGREEVECNGNVSSVNVGLTGLKRKAT